MSKKRWIYIYGKFRDTRPIDVLLVSAWFGLVFIVAIEILIW